jgi:hypothetical protein
LRIGAGKIDLRLPDAAAAFVSQSQRFESAHGIEPLQHYDISSGCSK